jgi:hypothetical protein
MAISSAPTVSSTHSSLVSVSTSQSMTHATPHKAKPAEAIPMVARVTRIGSAARTARLIRSENVVAISRT